MNDPIGDILETWSCFKSLCVCLAFFVLFCFVTEVPHKCVSTGSANGSYVYPLYYVSLARMEKRGRNQFFLPRHTAKLSILPSPFGMPLQNFIWEHKIYYCTCKSICLISHQRTDPTVEYSLKNGAAVKQLPFAIRTKIHSFNIRLRDSEKNSQKAKLFFKKAI